MTFHRFRIGLMSFILLFLYNCKEPKPVQQLDETTSTEVVPIPKTLKALAEFTEISLEETSEIDEIFRFKLINSDGSAGEMESEVASSFLKRAMSGKQSSDAVAVECIPSEKIILLVQGSGYGGAIWGKLLLNPTTMTFEKVAFEHHAEAEGYGAAMTLSSFEKQFTGKDISKASFRFELKQLKRETTSGSALIDGISGATGTTKSVVEMMNDGLDRYGDYLKELHQSKNQIQ